MALVTAKSAANLATLDLHAWLASATATELLDNVNIRSAQLVPYEDALRWTLPGGTVLLGGFGLTTNAAGAPTGGTVTGLLRSLNFVQWYDIERIAVDAVTVQAAAVTVSTADDMALYAAMLGGADTFNLSEQNDVADGFDGNDTLNGAGGNDTLSGNTADDRLDGGAGGDSMVGGSGHDTYMVDDPADRVVETVTGEDDLVFSSISYTLPANVERLNLNVPGSGALNGVGNSLDNLVGGNPGDNRLFGLAGNDWLGGGAGNDTLVGGTGSDTMEGFLGDDVYEVDSVSDTVTEVVDFGLDTVRSTVDLTLSADVENLVLVGAALAGTGNALANVISGNAGNNTLSGSDGNDSLIGGAGNDALDGGTGIDTMLGGNGNDAYTVDNASDVVVETVAGGTDTVRSTVTRALGPNQENLVLTGTLAINGSGTSRPNSLTGNIAANVLAAGSGNDILNGGRGHDTLTGGPGLDTLRFTTPVTASSSDRVLDFVSADDRIELENAVFTALGATTGALAAAKFHVGSAAADAGDRIVYNQATGAMYYDADGNGAGAQILFAQLNAGTVISLDDLWVI